MKIRALAIIAALALPTLAIAQESPQAPKPTEKAAKLSANDVKIIAHLHHVNQMEIDLGKVGQKSATASVKSYSEALVKDHQSADSELTAFAKKRGLTTIPADKPETDAERQDQKEMTTAVAHLKTLKGAELEKEFLNMMVSSHEKEVSRIDASIAAASDPDLQTWLRSFKPVLQRHADQARDLQKSPQASADQPSETRPSSRTGTR
jgi:putative membrane protein